MRRAQRPSTENFIHRGIKLEIPRDTGFPERLNCGVYEEVDWLGNTVRAFDAKDVCVTFRFYAGTQTKPAKLVKYLELPRMSRTFVDRARDMAIGVASTAAVFYALSTAERVNALVAGL